MAKTLIVEDSHDFREFLKALLYARFPDMQIAEAETAASALRMFTLFRPEVVFVDINLPGDMNGLELVQRIRAADTTVRIAMITSHDLPEYRQASIRIGANFFISKGTATRADILAVMRPASPG